MKSINVVFLDKVLVDNYLRNTNAKSFVPAFQASAASGSEDFKTQEAKAMQTKHISDCFSVEKTPSRPVRDIKMHKKVVLLWRLFSFFFATSSSVQTRNKTYLSSA